MDAAGFARIWWRPWRWALLAAAVSCSSGGGEPALEFAVVHTDAVESNSGSPVQLPPEPTVAEGGAGSIHVRGLIAVPDQCDDVGAEVVADGAALTMRVVVRGSRRHSGACGRADRVVMAQYEATLRRLAPGPHQLRIVYDYRGCVRGSAGGRTIPRPSCGGTTRQARTRSGHGSPSMGRFVTPAATTLRCPDERKAASRDRSPGGRRSLAAAGFYVTASCCSELLGSMQAQPSRGG